MAYEPEQRYLRDVSSRGEANKPFDEQAPTDRGQFWAVRDHIRSRWARGGASFGLISASIYVLLGHDVPQLGDSHLASILAFFAAFALCGLAVGIAVASIRRRFTGEV